MKNTAKNALILLTAFASLTAQGRTHEIVLGDEPATRLVGKEVSVHLTEDVAIYPRDAAAPPYEHQLHSCYSRAKTTDLQGRRNFSSTQPLVLMLARIETAPLDPASGARKVSFDFDVRQGATELATVACSVTADTEVPAARDVENALKLSFSLDDQGSRTVIKSAGDHDINVLNPLGR